MTQENLDSLDGDLKAGNISEDEYMQILTDEVVRLHPEIDAYEIDNMVRLQLKSLAVDEQYCADNERTEEPKEIGQLESKDSSCGGDDADEKDAGAKEQSRDLKASSSGNEQQVAFEDDGNAQEKNAGENQQSSSSENGESQEANDSKGEEQRDQAASDKSENQESGSDQDSENSNEASSEQESGNEESQRSQDNGASQSQDDGNGDSDSSSGRKDAWMTWQIVPDWLTFGKSC